MSIKRFYINGKGDKLEIDTIDYKRGLVFAIGTTGVDFISEITLLPEELVETPHPTNKKGKA